MGCSQGPHAPRQRVEALSTLQRDCNSQPWTYLQVQESPLEPRSQHLYHERREDLENAKNLLGRGRSGGFLVWAGQEAGRVLCCVNKHGDMVDCGKAVPHPVEVGCRGQ